jgi:hypothetical protein
MDAPRTASDVLLGLVFLGLDSQVEIAVVHSASLVRRLGRGP